MYFDIAIIGGGFYGCYIADFYARQNKKVILIEAESDILQRASKNNQARIHGGYHYPRSTLTALRSRVLFEKFINEFKESVFDEFDMYYMIGKSFSKVSSNQFIQFCKRIGAPLERTYQLNKYVDSAYVDSVFKAKEFAFDVNKLRETIKSRVNNSNVKIYCNHKAYKVSEVDSGNLVIHIAGSEISEIFCKTVFNCTYYGLNNIRINETYKEVPLKHEKVEIALVNVPDEIKGMGFTLMDGPFFSCMPFPSENLHSLTHVRYTPQASWMDGSNNKKGSLVSSIVEGTFSNYKAMMLDAARYIPSISKSEYVKSIWDIKTILPKNEIDDGRPILFKINHADIKNYHCVLGGKIDNVYDVIESIKEKGIGL